MSAEFLKPVAEWLNPVVTQEAQLGAYRFRVFQYPNSAQPVLFIQKRDGEEMGVQLEVFEKLIADWWEERF